MTYINKYGITYFPMEQKYKICNLEDNYKPIGNECFYSKESAIDWLVENKGVKRPTNITQ